MTIGSQNDIDALKKIGKIVAWTISEIVAALFLCRETSGCFLQRVTDEGYNVGTTSRHIIEASASRRRSTAMFL